MRRLVPLVTALFAVAVLSAATPSHKTSTKTKRSVSRSKVKARAPQSSAKVSSRGARKSKAGRRVVAARSSVQGQPSQERYQQIQQALADKGYYSGEVNGKWNAESSDALKRFQQEQNLSADGKLNSLSLIALGLGPKRLSAQTAPAQGAPSNPKSGERP